MDKFQRFMVWLFSGALVYAGLALMLAFILGMAFANWFYYWAFQSTRWMIRTGIQAALIGILALVVYLLWRRINV